MNLPDSNQGRGEFRPRPASSRSCAQKDVTVLRGLYPDDSVHIDHEGVTWTKTR
jgi:hypothetical protein